MHYKIIFCVTWTFLANWITSVLCDVSSNPFKAEPKCIDESNVCSLALKCNAGMMVELPVQGLMGPPGPPGEAGPTGVEGVSGETGPPGMPGPVGAPGEPGPPGLVGEMGYPGRRGDKGLTGEVGRPGERGAPGEMGFQGEIGPRGDMGPPGEVGLTGESGYAGEPGLPGERGPFGEPGAMGPPGERGHAGEPGMDGPKGAPGPPGKSNDCRVAFQASVQTPKDYSGILVNTPLTFDKVLINVEDAFIPSNGIFIAPFKGTFAFYVSTAAQEGALGAVLVQHNEKHIGTVYADSRASWGSASSTYILNLEKKAVVRFLVAKSAPSLYGSMYTSVSGTCMWRDE